MAAISPVCKCVLQQVKLRHVALLTRKYTVRPPKWMGYRHWKGYNLAHEETNPIYTEKTLSEILAERQPVMAKESPNIGHSLEQVRPSQRDVLDQRRRNRADTELEKAARYRKLEVPLHTVREDWEREVGPSQIRAAAEHYGIFCDLFEDAHFYCSRRMTVAYEYDNDLVTPVYRGNKIPASEAAAAPLVEIEGGDDKLYTLVMTNPDSHMTDNEAEVLHWMVGNIKESDSNQGELLCSYLPPFPARGTGFHRHVFLLFEHDQKVDFSSEKRPDKCASLKERTFKTADFYAKFEKDITPVCVNFFQAEWDQSVREVFHNILNMKEPEFAYKFPHPYHPRQILYPRKQPFDRYFDRYRDKKDLAEEVMKIKMEMTSPFQPSPGKPKYPSIHKQHGKPSWLVKRENIMARRLEQYADLPQ